MNNLSCGCSPRKCTYFKCDNCRKSFCDKHIVNFQTSGDNKKHHLCSGCYQKKYHKGEEK